MKESDTIEKNGTAYWFDYSVTYAAVSDRGRVRKANEDSFLVLEDEMYFAVADGAGGHDNGARASFLTVHEIEKYLKKPIDKEDATVPLETASELSLTTQAIQQANRTVFGENESGHMASTIVGGQLHQGKILLEHVGDSRCYLYRDNRLEQMTEDHSFVNDLFRSNKISREEMKTHKYRNVITRAVGVESEVKVDGRWVECREGDIFLFCSDGLTGFVTDEQIASDLSANLPLPIMAQTLVDQANQGGGRDNITVVLLQLMMSEKTVQINTVY